MTVVIGRVHYGNVAPEWIDNFTSLQMPTKPDGSPDALSISMNRLIVHAARNLLTMWTLGTAAPEGHDPLTDATHLFFLDDDVLAPPDTLMRLLSHDVPIVAGLYMNRVWPHNPIAFQRATVRGKTHYLPVTRFCAGLQEVDAVGAGCLLIRRDVLEAIPPPWWDYVLDPALANVIPEDVYFCQKAQAAGFPILLDFDVQCEHLALVPVGLQHWRNTWDNPQARMCQGVDLAEVAIAPRPWPPQHP